MLLAMALASWMIPELSLSSELQLESHKRIVRTEVTGNPTEVAELACSLMTQLSLQESILRKATHRIAELELQELLNAPQPPQVQEAYVVAGRISWLMRIALAVEGRRKCHVVAVPQQSS